MSNNQWKDDICNTISQIQLKQVATDKRLDEISKSLGKNEKSIVLLYESFPENDLGGHRRYHDALKERLRRGRTLRRAIAEKTISGIIWSLLLGVGLFIWKGLQSILRGLM